VVLLDNLADDRDALPIAYRLLEVLRKPYQVEIHEIVSTVSMGIVTSQHRHERAEDVLRDADIAMYEAKAAGRNRAVLFDGDMYKKVQRKLELENGLRRALAENQMVLHYQPVISLKTGVVESLEALVRWQHPALGMISPGEFIPVAEESGLIVPLGEWVCRTAFRQLADWQRMLGQGAVPAVNINLSRKQCLERELPQRLGKMARDAGVTPSCVHLEVTEGDVMANPQALVSVLRELRREGFRLDIDDFGTGHSSLSSLHEFPIDLVKIDRSFVTNLSRGREYIALVDAIVNLAGNLNIGVIAEGVETADQVTILQTLECQRAQGYFFSRPFPGDDVPAYVRRMRSK
jgi:EAL domain-containing protein (putative c-di-GMP-specific phosphodiesterase class I)